MSADQLDQRLAVIEKTLADIQRQVDGIAADQRSRRWWERVGREMTPEQQQVFDEMTAYGRYFRKTGQEAPPEWKPGDPIPEPEWW